MASRRLTNNSVSSLGEQSEVIQSILEKEKPKEGDSKLRKSRKRKAKVAEALGKKPKDSDKGESRFIERESDHDHEPAVWPTWAEAQAQAMVDGAGQMVLGNAVPGYNFGQVERPAWADEEVSLEEQDGELERQDHEISEDETEMIESDQEQEQVLPVVPAVSALLEIKKKGAFADILKENLNKVKEADKVTSKLAPEVASGVEKYLKDCVYVSDMEKLVKDYPRVDNVESMKVPRLDIEVYQVIEQHVRTFDQQLQSIQKGIVGAISAISPLLDLGFERADSDVELDACARGIWDSVQLMAFALNGISQRRRDLIKPSLAPIYAQVLTKGHDTTPEWLYGGNLVETTKKCEAAKRISEKILAKKPQKQIPKAQPKNHQINQRGRGRGQMRGFNPYQKFRMPNPQQMLPNVQSGGFHMDPQQVPRYQFAVPYIQQGQQGQQFPKNKMNIAPK